MEVHGDALSGDCYQNECVRSPTVREGASRILTPSLTVGLLTHFDLFGWPGWAAGAIRRLMFFTELIELGALLRRQHLIDRSVFACSQNGQLDHRLRLARGDGADLRFVELTLRRGSFQRLVRVADLLLVRLSLCIFRVL